MNKANNEAAYRYVVQPGFTLSAEEKASCVAASPEQNCAGPRTAAAVISFNVTGATFSLLLPDGNLAVVNCVSKYKPIGDGVNRRSCRVPASDTIEAEIKGSKARLMWPSASGKKTESETYKILAVLDSILRKQ